IYKICGRIVWNVDHNPVHARSYQGIKFAKCYCVLHQ
uniref:Uncharacterized protein n=1 Tax=Aegilops tauschii subsp. strangulata TaxID=200361 RepID=A0A452Y4P4_AEGTS